ncbi:amino acid ABC transporter permease [Nocardioides sp.]|uniref:amino acid ABC transporter permease n=1 Tax=Nocardioides sp. TaxID=35761 RepID=UPI003D0F0476
MIGSPTASGLAEAPKGASAINLPHEDVAQARARKKPWRWLFTALLAIMALHFLDFLLTNENLQWSVVGDYLFDAQVLDGVANTLRIWAIVTVLSTVFGAVICSLQMSTYAPARWVSKSYVAVFLAIPPLVQLIFWFNIAYLVPELSIGLPFGPSFNGWDTNAVVDPFAAAIVGLTIVESAYIAEIIRGAMLSVPQGQRDAAKAVGFGSRTTYFRVVLPQALRAIIPPWGTKVVSIVKATSLVSIIGQTDLLRAVQDIYNRNYLTVPLLIVAIIWYLVIVSVLTTLRNMLERRYSRGFQPGAPVGKRSGRRSRTSKVEVEVL